MAELHHRALPYVEQCLLLRTCARLLRLPARAIVAALLFLHRFYRACPAEERHQRSPQLLVAACICLASKVEEVSVSNNHLLNTVNIVAHLCMQQPSQTTLATHQQQPAAGPSTALPWAERLYAVTPAALDEQLQQTACDVLVGQSYYDAKAQLLLMEQRLLRHMRFQLLTEQPHAHLLHVLDSVLAPAPVVSTAISLMNDLATFSTCLLDTPPLQLAVAVVYVGSQLLGVGDCLPPARGPTGSPRPDPQQDQMQQNAAWYEAIGVAQADVELLGHRILDILQLARIQFSSTSTQLS